MQAGADFIKTSTGKEGVNATIPFGVVMCRMIREYFEQTGYAVGFKPAGGIRTAKNVARVSVSDEGRAGRSLAACRTSSASARARCSPTSNASSSISSPAATPRRIASRCRSRRTRSILRTPPPALVPLKWPPSPKSSKRWSTARRRRATRKRSPGSASTSACSATTSTARGPSRARCSTSSIRRRAKSSRASRNGTAADVDAAVAAARAALPAWKALAPHARARYLYALARGVQKHSRLLAVLESMDNGKSIRETRDIDIPLVARHFYHHAGWAQLLDTRVRRLRGDRRRRADHSVELPAADARVEDRAGARGR